MKRPADRGRDGRVQQLHAGCRGLRWVFADAIDNRRHTTRQLSGGFWETRVCQLQEGPVRPFVETSWEASPSLHPLQELDCLLGLPGEMVDHDPPMSVEVSELVLDR